MCSSKTLQESSAINKDFGGWLESIGFAQYGQEVEDWCQEEGASFVHEAQENWEDLANHIHLAGLERERFGRACKWDPTRVFCAADAQYMLLEQLGAGATATVHRCKTKEGNEFAAKVIDVERLCRFRRDAEELKSKLDREISILRTLRHNRLVCLEDVVETDMRLYLVMELVRGGELYEHIVNQPEQCLPEAECRYIFEQLIDALKYIHSKNVVHRDLKAENVLIDSVASTPGRPEIKLLDFGHSKLIRDGYNRAESIVGTPACWAPEVSDPGSPCYDERADLWSLGVLLYLMLVGKYPFDAGDDRNECFSFQGKRKTEELVRGLICVRPENRMTLAQCSESAWVDEGSSALTSMLSNRESPALCQPEVRVRLPREPSKLRNFNKKLVDWSREQKVAARLDILDVVVTLSPNADAAKVWRARRDLLRLLGQEFPEFKEKKASSMGQDQEIARAREGELQELEANYGRNLEILDEFEWRIRLGPDDALRVRLTAQYPLSAPPTPLVDCASCLQPWFCEDDLLDLWSPGHPCIYAWVERLRDALIDPKLPSKSNSCPMVGRQVQQHGSKLPSKGNSCPVVDWQVRPLSISAARVVEGEPLIIKGWSFRGYFMRVASQEEAVAAHKAWLQTKAVVAASFNISAYRLESGPAQFFSARDGSKQDSIAEAGRSLSALLDAQATENVLIMLVRIKDVAIQNQVHLSRAMLLRQDEKVARRLLDQCAVPPRGGAES